MTELQSDTASPPASATAATPPPETARRGPDGEGRWMEVSRRARGAADLANRQAKAAGAYSATQVRAKPLRSVALAVGAGIVLGALIFG